METWIPRFYQAYGIYANCNKMLPSAVDGTIPVWKRLLLSAHTWARKDFVKSANIFGQTIAHWHPHTEAIEGTAEILVQNGFLDGHGNWGSTIGIQPESCAAPRYTELRMNDLVEEIAFKYVDDVVWKADDLDPEPVILPTMIPICLFGKSELNMIGFGFKTEIATYKLSDLIKRLLFLLGKHPKIIIHPNISGCHIKSSDEELEKLLTTKGKHEVKLKGFYSKDPKTFSVFIHGWSPRSNFSNVFKRIDSYNNYNLMTSGDVTVLDESKGTVGTKILLEVNRARNREAIYNKLLNAVDNRLEASISYHMYAVSPEMAIVETCVDEMLMNAYKYFVATLKVHFQRKIKEITTLIKELEVIKKIRPHISRVYNLPSHKEMVEQLANFSGLTIDEVESTVNKHKIKKLLSTKLDIESHQKDLAVCKDLLKNTDPYALKCYEELLVKAQIRDDEEDKKTRNRAFLNKVQQSTDSVKHTSVKIDSSGITVISKEKPDIVQVSIPEKKKVPEITRIP